MNTLARNSRLQVIVLLLVVLSMGQLVCAQDSGDSSADVPPWVRDRQQYETTYVYAPPASDMQPTEIVDPIPQWVCVRQQYETTYIYVPWPGDE